jgi:hypothetical protein
MLKRSMVFLVVLAASLVVFAAPAMAGFGFLPGDEGFAFNTVNADGSTAMQAGAHPVAVTTNIGLNLKINESGIVTSDGDIKDTHIALAPGFVGDVNAIPQCTQAQFATVPPFREGAEFEGADCPPDTQIGVAKVTFDVYGFVAVVGVYNLVPPPGVPAMFGFRPDRLPIVLTPTVRTGGDYGLTVNSENIDQSLPTLAVSVKLWGVPADAAHDGERGVCLASGGSCPSEITPVALLRQATSCAGPQQTVASIDSWENPGVFLTDTSVSQDGSGNPVGLEGCNQLPFAPSITARPDTSEADTPAGLAVSVKVPQEGLLDPNGLGSADLKNVSVALPAGMAINPGRAVGLAVCPVAQDAIGTENAPSCPAGSRIGTARISTPLLSEPIEGEVFVVQSNPPDVKLLIAGSLDGINVKLLGDARLDEASGQITTSFTSLPQFPVSEVKLALDGGSHAPLLTPPSCGSFATSGDFTPWSTPYEADALSGDVFALNSTPGGACPGVMPFAPVLTAGSSSDQAAGSTAFSVLVSRNDGEQRIGGLQFKMPEGLLGSIAGVPRCGEPQAAQGTCPAGSQIGHVLVQAGGGPDTLTIPQPGEPQAPVYLTGPYNGAPFGLSIAVPVIAGPFNLGTVVVRGSIHVNPNTTQLTVDTGSVPSILDGVPTDLRLIDAVIDRPGFMFNPTNCTPTVVTGTATSTQGTTTALSSRFQVGACQSLKFQPKFTVSTQANTSKRNGASLTAKLAYPQAGQANIAKVAVTLPKALPSRLTTIQQACPEATFNANPASCPAGSNIGVATASTPVLANPVVGPAYLVSHGGAAFPDLVLILQGEGVKLELIGSINIKKSITSSAFNTVPDAPIRSFELKLPEGPHSGLAAVLPAKAKGSLCGSSLTMPTTLTGQNGAQIKQNTRIAVTGCGKTKKKPKAKKPKHGKKK